MKSFLIKQIKMLLLGIACLTGGHLLGQDLAATLNGTVTDEQGHPLSGVVITSENGRNGTSTNGKGEFAMSIDDGSEALMFALYGFQDIRLSVSDKQDLNVRLVRDVHQKDEVIQLGYTSQKRSEITGSVATIKGEELERAPVANLTQTLPGRLAGLTTYEEYSELSRATTNLNIRGLAVGRESGPLVMIDGIVNSYNSAQTLEYITANEIESITLLKDASTQALYGIQGASGLIVVTTKRGRKGPLQIKTRFDESVQQVTTRPTFYNSADYAQMRNQAAFNDGHGQNYLFSQAQIDGYRSGQNPELYPNNNWYDHYIKDFATMQRASMNVTGGNDKVQFFSNINFMHQGGQFKTDQTRYNANANNIWVNYRSNVDMNLNRYLKAFIRLSGNVKRERTPGVGNASVYSSIFQIPPTMFGPVTQPVMDSSGEVIDAGGQVITTERVESPTYGMLNRTGYVRHTVTNITSQFGLDLDMGFLTKGLNLTGIFAYQTNSVGSLTTTQDYERWIRTNDSTSATFVKKGAQNNTPLAYAKGHSYYYHLTYNIAANYKRTFGRHHVGAMGYMFYQNLTKAETDSARMLPYNRVSSGFEVNYGFDNRYLLKLDLGYSGSEQYARGSRYTATPAISAGWVVSNEPFLKNNRLLSYLKLRASYGKAANDMSALARFAYLDNVTVTGGGPLAYLQYLVREGQVGNPNIRAEVSTKQNFGIDLGIRNMLTVTADVFKERMDNMIVSALSTIPLYQGIPLENYPRLNTGSFENQGFDLTVRFDKVISKDLSFHAGGLLGYAKNKIINWNEALRTPDYAFRKWEEGYSYGQKFGYLVDYSNGNGFFNSQAEIDDANLAYSFGTPRPGDLRYRDLNADGKIDERDKAPIGNGFLPRTTYGISGGLNFRSFELNVLFQGVGKFMTIEKGQGVFETDFDGVFGSLHRNAWTPERYANGEEITAPALSLAKTVNHEDSDYYANNRAYLRLKNIELAYSLPASIAKVILAERIRVLVSGQNLITWDKMKSKDYGPEGTYASFPVYRVFNAGISVTF